MLLIIASLWKFAPPHEARAQQPDVIEPRDVLTVTLWNQPDLSGKFPIEVDGTFTFPLIGRVKAGGLVLREVEDKLKELLAAGYFKQPQLTIAVDHYRHQMVHVIGEIRQPGSYPLTAGMTLIEMLARVGSTTDRAGGVVVVTRRHSAAPSSESSTAAQAGPEIVRVDLKSLQSGAPAENITLQDGDTVFVPRAEPVYVVGEVKTPGTYDVQGQTTVLQLIAMAGGLTDRGSSRRIRIVRRVGGGTKQIKVKLDELLLPGDTIVVGERLF